VTATPDEGEHGVNVPGISTERFEAAVRALIELRDNGKCLIFLGRRRGPRFVVDMELVRDTLKGKLSGPALTADEAEEILDEVSRYLAVLIQTGSAQQAVRFFTSGPFRRKEGDQADEEQFRKRVEAKVAVVQKELYTETIAARWQRMGSMTAFALEDVDFEVVGERVAALENKSVTEPFLRLKIRHAKETEQGSLPMMLLFLEGELLRGSGLDSFELECDESDIDLLMLRLDAAKKRLSAARESRADIKD
jgi:hypothetical protein